MQAERARLLLPVSGLLLKLLGGFALPFSIHLWLNGHPVPVSVTVAQSSCQPHNNWGCSFFLKCFSEEFDSNKFCIQIWHNEMEKLGCFLLLDRSFSRLFPPFCPAGLVFTEPLTCYVLDGFLMAYCIIATMLYFRLKVGGRLLAHLSLTCTNLALTKHVLLHSFSLLGVWLLRSL